MFLAWCFAEMVQAPSQETRGDTFLNSVMCIINCSCMNYSCNLKMC